MFVKENPDRKKKRVYCNDHLDLVKLGADSFLIEAVVADPGSFVCYYKSRRLEITNRGSYYKSLHIYYKSGELSQIGTKLTLQKKSNPQFPGDLVTFTEEILNGKLKFCAV